MKNKQNKAFSLIEISIVILIIGILIAGITQGSNLVRASGLSSARSLTKSSPVPTIAGLSLWLETSGGLNESALGVDNAAANSVATNFDPEDGNKIESWRDINPQVTNKRVLTIPVAQAISPVTYVRNGIKGLPSLLFDGSANGVFFSTVAPSAITAGNDNYTIIAVFNANAATPATNTAIVSFNPGATADNNSATLAVDSTRLIFESSVTSNTVNTASSATNYSLSAPHIAIIRANHTLAASNIEFYLDSNTAVQATTTTPANLAINSTSVAIGARYLSTAPLISEYFRGLISEVIVYDRTLKVSEIIDINKYLSQKYSITLK